jgi:hypothetical protein
LFEVRDQVGGGVGAQIHVRLGGVRRTASAVALVDENHLVFGRIEVPPPPGASTGARAAVDDKGRLALGVAADLPVHAVAVADVEQAVVVGLDLRVHAQRTPV